MDLARPGRFGRGHFPAWGCFFPVGRFPSPNGQLQGESDLILPHPLGPQGPSGEAYKFAYHGQAHPDSVGIPISPVKALEENLWILDRFAIHPIEYVKNKLLPSFPCADQDLTPKRAILYRIGQEIGY